MASPAPKDAVRRFIRAVNRQDFEALAELVAPRVVRHSGTAGQPLVLDRRALADFLRGEAETFPDARETILRLIAEGKFVAAHLRFRGTQRGPLGPYPATGTTVEADFMCIYRLARGKIAEVWVEWDQLAFLTKLGHLAPMTGDSTERRP
jgi:steroid delta-isomerase-like uncharacterized protein